MSVLLPVFNAAATLRVALDSVVRQSLRDWECIVVDDGSEDGSLEIAERRAAEDTRFVVIRRPHRGIVSTLADGLIVCRGRFVARIDADDIMLRRRLELQARCLHAAPTWSAVGCHVRMFPRRLLSDGLRAYERWLNSIDSPKRVAAESFVECPLAHPTLFARRDVLQRVGYRHVDWPEDYDLVLRLLAEGREVGVVPQRLVCWRDHPERLWRRDRRYSIESISDCKADFLARGFLAKSSDFVLWGYGDTGKALAKRLVARGKRVSHIVELHPGRIGQTIAGAPVITPEHLSGVRRRPLIVSVAGAGPRGEIRDALGKLGFVELRDYVCAA